MAVQMPAVLEAVHDVDPESEGHPSISVRWTATHELCTIELVQDPKKVAAWVGQAVTVKILDGAWALVEPA